MKPFWLSWYWPPSLGEFELHSPWWTTGMRCEDEAITVCAAVMAESEHEAKNIIDRAYDSPPGQLEWRFCEEMQPHWSPFTDRFQRADWMRWPDTKEVKNDA